MRTRVGYCGGSKLEPTYRDLGDHTEAIEIDYDPTVTDYETLLRSFLTQHNACRAAFSQQYRSVVFAHDAEQLKAARSALARESEQRGQAVKTLVESEFRFWLAEDYHQKYRLRRYRELDAAIQAVYPELEDYVNSTVATRLNAIAGGDATPRGLGLNRDDIGVDAKLLEGLGFKKR